MSNPHADRREGPDLWVKLKDCPIHKPLFSVAF